MNRTRDFRLATVERLRALEVRSHVQQLAAAASAVTEAVEYQQNLQTALDTEPSVGEGDPSLWSGVAAHRDRIREELGLVAAELARRHDAAAAARQAWLAARGRLQAVERLHERHRAAVRAEGLRRDQRELDELVSSRASRLTRTTRRTPATDGDLTTTVRRSQQ